MSPRRCRRSGKAGLPDLILPARGMPIFLILPNRAPVFGVADRIPGPQPGMWRPVIHPRQPGMADALGVMTGVRLPAVAA